MQCGESDEIPILKAKLCSTNWEKYREVQVAISIILFLLFASLTGLFRASRKYGQLNSTGRFAWFSVLQAMKNYGVPARPLGLFLSYCQNFSYR